MQGRRPCPSLQAHRRRRPSPSHAAVRVSGSAGGSTGSSGSTGGGSSSSKMPSVTALRRWLVFVALLRLFSGARAHGQHGLPPILASGAAAGQAQHPGSHSLRSCAAQWAWATRRRTASRPTCTPSSQRGVRASPQAPRTLPLPWPPAGARRVVPGPAPPCSLRCLMGQHAAAACRCAFVCAVTDLAGRIFSTWTLTSCVLCLICARNPCVPAIYGAHAAPLWHRTAGRGRAGAAGRHDGAPAASAAAASAAAAAAASVAAMAAAEAPWLASVCTMLTW